MVGTKNISKRGKTSGIHSVGDGIEPFPVFSSSCKDVIQIQKNKRKKDRETCLTLKEGILCVCRIKSEQGCKHSGNTFIGQLLPFVRPVGLAEGDEVGIV
jgi:hypothetical protein